MAVTARQRTILIRSDTFALLRLKMSCFSVTLPYVFLVHPSLLSWLLAHDPEHPYLDKDLSHREPTQLHTDRPTDRPTHLPT